MPSRPMRACNKPGCGRATTERYCDQHQELPRRHDLERPSAAKRGYDRRWRKYVKWFLAQPEHRICACGCGRLATEVDHIKPVSGPDDPMFWSGSNHQGLTHECHSRKTMSEMRRKIG